MNLQDVFNRSSALTYTIQENNNKGKKGKKKKDEPKPIDPRTLPFDDPRRLAFFDTSNNQVNNNVTSAIGNTMIMGDTEKYAKYGINPLRTRLGVNLDEELSDAQSNWAKAFGAVMQTASELTLGVAKGFTDLGGALLEKMGVLDEDYHNVASDWIQSAKDWISEDLAPIYANPYKTWGDFGWWMQNIPSIASTVSLMIPARGVSKAVGALGTALKTAGKAGKLGKVGKVASRPLASTRKWLAGTDKLKAAKAPNWVDNLVHSPKAIERMKVGRQVLGEGLMMRAVENYQEAGQTYDQTYQDVADTLNSKTDEDYNAWVEENKDHIKEPVDFNDRDAVAKAIAKQAADRTFTMDFANLMFDVAQLYSLRNLGSRIKEVKGKGLSKASRESQQMAKTAVKGEEEIKKALQNTVDNADKLKPGFWKRTGVYTKDLAKDFGKTFLAESTEGVEEAINYIAQQEGITYGKMLAEGRPVNDNEPTILGSILDAPDKLIEYKDAPGLWESAFWGLLGGIAFGEIHSKIQGNKIKKANQKKVEEEYNKQVELINSIKDISEEERKKMLDELKQVNKIEKYFIGYEDMPDLKAAKEAILDRSFRLSKLVDDLKNIDAGKNIYGEQDEHGYVEFTGDVSVKQAAARQRAIKEYQQSIALDALNSGTFSSLRDYFQSKEVKEAMAEINGIDDVESFVNETLATMDDVANTYERQATLINTNAIRLNKSRDFDEEIPMEFIRLMANQNTTKILNAKAYQAEADKLNAEINAQMEGLLEGSTDPEGLREALNRQKDLIQLNTLLDIHAQLHAQERYIRDNEKESFTKDRKLREIARRKEAIINDLKKHSPEALALATIRQKVYEYAPGARGIGKILRTDNNEYFTKTDEELINLYREDINKLTNGYITNDNVNDVVQSLTQYRNQLKELAEGNDSFTQVHADLTELLQNQASYSFFKNQMLSQVISTPEEIADAAQEYNIRLSTAAQKAVQIAENTFTDLFRTYKDTNIDKFEDAMYKAITSSKEEAREIVEEFMTPDDANKFMDTLTIFKFRSATNETMARYFMQEINKAKESLKHKKASDTQSSTIDTSDHENTENSSDTTTSTNDGTSSLSESLNQLTENSENPQSTQTNIRKTRSHVTLTNDGQVKTIRKAKNRGNFDVITYEDGTGVTRTELDFTNKSKDTKRKWMNNGYFNVIDNGLALSDPDTDFDVVENPEIEYDTRRREFVLRTPGTIELFKKGETPNKSEVINSNPVEEIDDSETTTEEDVNEEDTENNDENNNNDAYKGQKAIEDIDTSKYNTEYESGVYVDPTTGEIVQSDTLATTAKVLGITPLHSEDSFVYNDFNGISNAEESYSGKNVTDTDRAKTEANPRLYPIQNSLPKTNLTLENVVHNKIYLSAQLFTNNDNIPVNDENGWAYIYLPRDLSTNEAQVAVDWINANAENVKSWKELVNGLVTAINSSIGFVAAENQSVEIDTANTETNETNESETINELSEDQPVITRADIEEHVSTSIQAMIPKDDPLLLNTDIEELRAKAKDKYKSDIEKNKDVEHVIDEMLDEFAAAKADIIAFQNSATEETKNLIDSSINAANQSIFANTRTLLFNNLFATSIEKLIKDYVDFIQVPKVKIDDNTELQGVYLEDIVTLLNSATGNKDQTSHYIELVKYYLETQGKDKYVILDANEDIENNILNPTDSSDTTSSVSRLRAITDEFDTLLARLTPEEFDDFEQTFDSLIPGDELDVVDLEETPYKGETDRVGLAKNGTVVAFYPTTYVINDQRSPYFGHYHTALRGWYCRIYKDSTSVQSPLKDFMTKVLFSTDEEFVDLRNLILKAKYHLNKANNSIVDNKTANQLENEFWNNDEINRLYTLAQQDNSSPDRLFNAKTAKRDRSLHNLPQELEYLIDIYDYCHNTINVNNPRDNQVIRDSLDEFFDKIYAELDFGNQLVPGRSKVVLNKVNDGKLIVPQDDTYRDTNYEELKRPSESVAKDTDIVMGYSDGNKLIVADSRKQVNRQAAKNAVFAVVFDKFGQPTYTNVYGIRPQSVYSNQDPFNDTLNHILHNFKRSLSSLLKDNDINLGSIEDLIGGLILNVQQKNDGKVRLFRPINSRTKFSVKAWPNTGTISIGYNYGGKNWIYFDIYTKSLKSGTRQLSYRISKTENGANKVIDRRYDNKYNTLAGDLPNELLKFLGDKIQFCIDRTAIDNATTNDDIKSGVLQRHDGKYSITFPRISDKIEFDDYNKFLIDNDLVKINIGQKNGRNFQWYGDDKKFYGSVYIAPTVTTTADSDNQTIPKKKSTFKPRSYHVVEPFAESEKMGAIEDIMNSDSTTKGIDVIKEAVADDTEATKRIEDLEKDKEGQQLLNTIVPPNLVFDPSINVYSTAEHRWLDGAAGSFGYATGRTGGSHYNTYVARNGQKIVRKVKRVPKNSAVFGLRWLNTIASRDKEQRRSGISKLIHEGLHIKLRENPELYDAITDEIKNIKQEFDEWLDKAKQDGTYDALSDTQKSQIDYINNVWNYYEGEASQAEEFFVESLTARDFHDIFNMIKTDVTKSKKETLWSKLLNLINKLFGWSVTEGSLLDKHLQNLRELTSVRNSDITNNTKNKNNNTNTSNNINNNTTIENKSDTETNNTNSIDNTTDNSTSTESVTPSIVEEETITEDASKIEQLAIANETDEEDDDDDELDSISFDSNASMFAETSIADTRQNYTTEMNAIKEQAIKDGTFMKAPNGNPSNLNERQWLQVRTQNFKNWFGDWENNSAEASKVVDENGEPKVVYHGTNIENINVFDRTKVQDKDTLIGTGTAGFGNFFSDSKEDAKSFADVVWLRRNKEGNSTVYDTFLNIKNPMYFETLGDFRNYSRKEGHYNDDGDFVSDVRLPEEYDGVIVKRRNQNDSSKEFVAPNPNQIKSATDNSGAFSNTNPDINDTVQQSVSSDFNSNVVTTIDDKAAALDIDNRDSFKALVNEGEYNITCK